MLSVDRKDHFHRRRGPGRRPGVQRIPQEIQPDLQRPKSRRAWTARCSACGKWSTGCSCRLPVFAQRPVTGFFHAVIFWGFLVFLGVTLNHVAEGFFAGFSLFGHGALYSLLLFAANLFAGLIIAGRPLFFRAPLHCPRQEPGAPLLAVADRAFFHLHPDGQLPVLRSVQNAMPWARSRAIFSPTGPLLISPRLRRSGRSPRQPSISG